MAKYGTYWNVCTWMQDCSLVEMLPLPEATNENIKILNKKKMSHRFKLSPWFFNGRLRRGDRWNKNWTSNNYNFGVIEKHIFFKVKTGINHESKKWKVKKTGLMLIIKTTTTEDM